MKHYVITLLFFILAFPPLALTNNTQPITLHNTAPLVIATQQFGYTGTVIHYANSANSARFKSEGPSSSTVTGEVIESKITLSNTNTNKSIVVFGWSYSGDMNQSGKATYPNDIIEAHLDNLLVGASAYVPMNTSAGNYAGQAHFLIKNGIRQSIIPFDIKMAILAAQSIETERNMSFKEQMVGFTGTVILNANSPASAMFSATGRPRSSAVAEIIPAVVSLHNLQHTDSIQVYSFTFADETNSINQRTGEFHFPSAAGNSTRHAIMIGASAYYKPHLPAGVYTGTATLRITYR